MRALQDIEGTLISIELWVSAVVLGGGVVGHSRCSFANPPSGAKSGE